jgi:hypothetical protein
MTCPIDWCAFTWEAAATFTTGFLAVGGAVFIGLRQSKILASQHNVERLRLKAELFDKRYRVFVEFGVFLDIAAAGSANLQSIIEGTRQNVERSIFLFDKSIFEKLSPLFQLGQQQLTRVDPTRSSELLTARIGLYQVFEPWLKLDDSML